MAASDHRRSIEFVLDNLVWFILVAVLIIFSLTIPNYFQIGIFANIVEHSTFVGTMAIGLSLVLIAGNIDLSVESTLALAAMVTGLLFATRGAGLGIALTPEWLVIPVSLLIALAAGAAVGLTNAFFVVRLGMNSFIATLGAFIWVRGLVIALSGGRSAQSLPDELRFLSIGTIANIPIIAWISILCFVLFGFILNRTPFGRHLVMIGGNRMATFRAGIKIDRLSTIAFVLAGAIAGLAGWLLAVRTSGATANLGVGMLFQAFAAVVIGGVSLQGGVGTLSGVYAGVLLLSSINTAINLMGMPAHFTQIIHGGLVLLAMVLDTVKNQIRSQLA
jgi:ribose transport system permease protein